MWWISLFTDIILPLAVFMAILYSFKYLLKKISPKTKKSENRISLFFMIFLSAFMLLGPFPLLAYLFEFFLIIFLASWIFGDMAMIVYAAVILSVLAVGKFFDVDSLLLMFTPAIALQEAFHEFVFSWLG